MDDAEERAAEQHAREELAEHGGLADALGELAEEPGRDEERDERAEDVVEAVGVGHAARGRVQEAHAERRRRGRRRAAAVVRPGDGKV